MNENKTFELNDDELDNVAGGVSAADLKMQITYVNTSIPHSCYSPLPALLTRYDGKSVLICQSCMATLCENPVQGRDYTLK